MKEDIEYHLDYGEPESGETLLAERNEAGYGVEKSSSRSSLFWRFPCGKGGIQPWRRRLWELQNNSDPE